MAKAHLLCSATPQKDGGKLEAACGKVLEPSEFVLALDTTFTVGHSIREVVSANSLLFCKRCLVSPLEHRYLYAVTGASQKLLALSEGEN